MTLYTAVKFLSDE